MKTAFAIVTLSSLLAGCASFGSHSVPAATTAAAASKAGDAAANSGDRPDNAPNLPKQALTSELLYKMLMAELADQRGDWQSGYVTMLGAAQQTRDPRLAQRAAEMALGAKHPEEALAAVRLWHELAPQSEEASQYLVGFLLLGNDLDDARPILEQRLKEARPATRGLIMFQIQRQLAGIKNKAAAFAMLEKLAAPYLSMQETHLALALAASNNGDAARARLEAHKALTMKPDSELAALTLAQVTPDKNEALAALRDFIAAHPKVREVRIAYARMLLDQKQYEQAQAQLDAMLKNDPDDMTALYALGLLDTQTGDLKSAEANLSRYLDLLAQHPDDERDPSQAMLVLAQIAQERGDNAGALKWLAQIDSNDIGTQIRRAQITAKAGDLQGAIALLHEPKPDDQQAQIQLIAGEAQILRDANRNEQVLTVLKEGLKRFPDNVDLLYDYAMAAEKLDRLDTMESALRKMIALAPGNQNAYNALGYSLAERNIRLPEAHALVEKALKLAPEDPFIMDSMGWVLFRQGKLGEAEQMLRRAYALRSDPEIAAHLGEVLWARGQHSDAQQVWRDASHKDPKNDTLNNTLTRLHVKL